MFNFQKKTFEERDFVSVVLFFFLVGAIFWQGYTLTESIKREKDSRDKYREVERYLYLSGKASGSGSWVWDVDNLEIENNEIVFNRADPVWYSEVFADNVGYKKGEFEENLGFFLNLLHPEDVDRVKTDVSKSLLSKDEIEYTTHYRLKHKNGQWIPCIVQGLVSKGLRDEKILAGATFYMRPALSRQLQNVAIIENSPLATITCDKKGLITGWNKKAETLFQWKKEEVVGKSTELIIPLKYRPSHEDAVERLVGKLEKGVKETPLKNLIKGQAVKKDGTLIEVVLVMKDISVQGNIEFAAFVVSGKILDYEE